MKKQKLLSILLTLGMTTTAFPSLTLAEEVHTNSQHDEETNEMEEEAIIAEENEEVSNEEPAEEIQEESVTDKETEEPDEEDGSQPDIDLRQPKIDDGMFHYIDENGTDHSTDAHLLEFVEDKPNSLLDDGWYIVTHDWTFNNRLVAVGDAKLILADGVTLNMVRGIRVNQGQTLNIYAQSSDENMGRLNCESEEYAAGIGGNCNESNGTVNIYGGNIRSIAKFKAAGIGGGRYGHGGNVNIYGGVVHAEAGYHHDEFPCSGAGIGGGPYNAGGRVRIFGGKVYAYSAETRFNGVDRGAGIGGGGGGYGGTIEIYGGEIEAHGHVALGHGANATSGENIILGEGMGVRNFNYEDRYDVLAIAHDAWIEPKDPALPEVSYLDADGEVNKLTDYRRLSTRLDNGNDIYTSGWYVADKDLTFENRPTIQGEVNLILPDGITLNIVHGIRNREGQTLSIYAQSNGDNMGRLLCGSYEHQAGIGGGDCGNGGIVRIYGGTVKAAARHASSFWYDIWGAGIGGGDEGKGGTVEIYGGTIEAHGYHAIGAGKDSDGSVNLSLGDDVNVDGVDYNDRYHVMSYAQDAWISPR